MSYDVVLFGSWCSKGVEVGGDYYASPDTYPVVGLNVSALYNFGYKFRAGVSLDGVYDGSANIYVTRLHHRHRNGVRPPVDRPAAGRRPLGSRRVRHALLHHRAPDWAPTSSTRAAT